MTTANDNFIVHIAKKTEHTTAVQIGTVVIRI